MAAPTSCCCISVEHFPDDSLYSVEVFLDDEQSALSTYFQDYVQSGADNSHVRIVSIKVEHVLSTTENSSSSAVAGANPIRLTACKHCENKSSFSRSESLQVTENLKNSCQDFSVLRSRTKLSSPSTLVDPKTQTRKFSRFSDLLRKLFLDDAHGRCTVTLVSESDLLGSSGDVAEIDHQKALGQFGTPNSSFSPLSQSVASIRKIKGERGTLQTEVKASLYAAGASIGLLHIDAPLYVPSAALADHNARYDESSVTSDGQWDRSNFQHNFQDNSPAQMYDLDSKQASSSTTMPGIAFYSSSQSLAKTSPTVVMGSYRSKQSVRTTRVENLPPKVERRRAASPSTCSDSVDSGSRNKSAVQQSDQLSMTSRSSKGGSSRGPGSGSGPRSSHLTSEREKGSKRSIETANRLTGILNKRGKDGQGASERLSRKETAPIAVKTSARTDMKSLLRQSSAGAFEGLQLDTVDPDFVFPGSAKTSLSPALRRSHSCDSKLIAVPQTQTPSDLQSGGVAQPSAGSYRQLRGRKQPVESTVSIEQSNALGAAIQKIPDWKASSLLSAKTLVLPSYPTAVAHSVVADELVCFKEGLSRSQAKSNEQACPCPSTPSTVADTEELTCFAETYKQRCPSYEVMPQDDGSLFTGLGRVSYPDSGYTALDPPEESLAYSAYSPSDTRDLLSPQGARFLSRTLSSQRSSSVLGTMFTAVTGFFSTVMVNSESACKVADNATVAVGDAGVGDGVMASMATKSQQEFEPDISCHNMDVKNLDLEIPEPPIPTSSKVSSEQLNLADLQCDATLLPMLSGLSKLASNVAIIIVDCIVHRKVLVLEAAIALNNILLKNIKAKKSRKESDKRKKNESQQVSSVLEKITKQRLGGNLAVAQVVSAASLLLVYLQLEMQRDEPLMAVIGDKKKVKSVDQSAILKTNKVDLAKERALKADLNDLIVSRFDRLALTALSPFLLYDDVQWLTLSGNESTAKPTAQGADSEAVGAVDSLRSPRLRKRKAAPDDVCVGSGREIKRKRSGPPTPGAIPPRSKRDCLWDIVCAVRVRYQTLGGVSSALRRLARNYRPTVGCGESESDSSPLRSPGAESPVVPETAMGDRQPDGFLALLSNKELQPANLLRRQLSIAGRTQPMIPLSVAGTALLFSMGCDPTPTLPPITTEPADLSLTLNDSVGSNGASHKIKRTNSIVNVHKTAVGQRTGRGKGKSVRTSLKPDPNINSILSFTVPQRASACGVGVRRSPSTGSSTGTGGSKSVKGAKGAERSKTERPNTGKSPTSSSSSSSNAVRRSGVPSYDASDLSGGSVRRSARKRARDEGGGGDGGWTKPGGMCDVSEVEDTPVDKVRARRSRGTFLASGIRVLRAASPGWKESGEELGPNGGSSSRGRSGSDVDSWSGVVASVGIADLFTNTVFTSGGSGKRNGARKRSSSPFFLPSVDNLLSQYSQEGNQEGCADMQTHSAGAALGMESTAHRKSPRLIHNIMRTRASSSATPLDFELGGLMTSSGGSFSRNIFSNDDTTHERGAGAWDQQALVQLQTTPLAHARGRREKRDWDKTSPESGSGSLITTPPAKSTSRPKTRPQTAMSPVPTNRSIADSSNHPNSARKSNFNMSRTSPRRHYSPV